MKQNFGNKRLEYMIHKVIEKDLPEGVYFISCYQPRKIYKDIYPTITTRIDDANNHFIVEVKDE